MPVISQYNKGLEDAANYLIGTAKDYEQNVDRIRRNAYRTDREQRECNIAEEKAQLLRGQAGHILELKQK